MPEAQQHPPLLRPWGPGSLALALVLVGIGLAVVFVVWGMPPPGSDDAWYKGPAATLATTGRLAAPGLTGYFPRAHDVYAGYPPLAMYVIAAFYAVLGVGRRSTLVYDMVVHVAGAVAIGLVALRLVSAHAVERRTAWWCALATGLVWLAGHRVLDRLEGLGLLFLWLELALPRAGARFPVLRAVASGICVAGAALTAPLTGVLAAGVLSLRDLFHAWDELSGPYPVRALRASARALPYTVASGLTAASLFGLWVLWVERPFPGVFREQFLGAMQDAGMVGRTAPDLGRFLELAISTVFVEATLVPGLVLASLWFPIAARELPVAGGAAALESRRLAQAAYVVGLGAVVLGTLWRPSSYFYFWHSAALVMPCLGLVFARFRLTAGSAWAGWSVPAATVAIAWYAVGVTSFFAYQEDPRGRLDGSTAALRAIVPPGELVATSTTFWPVFEGRNPWRDAVALYRRDATLLVDCDWLVVSNGVGSDRPEAVLHEFELVEALPTQVPVQVTYAWAVYRRRE